MLVDCSSGAGVVISFVDLAVLAVRAAGTLAMIGVGVTLVGVDVVVGVDLADVGFVGIGLMSVDLESVG